MEQLYAARDKRAGVKTSTYVVLLRGINVGGKNRLPMATLQQLCADAGCTRVATYIQSGNVVVTAKPAVAKTFATTLAAAITNATKLVVPVVVVAADELLRIVRDNPYVAAGAPEDALHVALLAHAPTAAAIASLDAERSPPDTFVVRGRAIYLHLPQGVGKTKLTNAYFDRALATISTVRNWRTLQALVAMANEQGA